MLSILVVDDEQTQRDTLCRGIRLMGHRCLTAANGAEALKWLVDHGEGSVDLLITDLTMPGISGLELLQSVRIMRPNLRLLAITGLNMGSDLEAIRALGIPMLQKPFGPGKLEDAIRAQL